MVALSAGLFLSVSTNSTLAKDLHKRALHLQAVKEVQHLQQKVAELQVQSSAVALKSHMSRVIPLILLLPLRHHLLADVGQRMVSRAKVEGLLSWPMCSSSWQMHSNS